MKKTGAIFLSILLVVLMTVTNMAGAYQSAVRVYAAEETDGVVDNPGGVGQGGVETVLTNDVLPTGDVPQFGDQTTMIMPVQDENVTPSPLDTTSAPLTQDAMPASQDDLSVNDGDPANMPPQDSDPGFMSQDSNQPQDTSPVPLDATPAPQDANPIPEEENTPAATFTVTFDANGHGEAPAPVKVNSGEIIAEPAAPKADGWIFTGWFHEAAATTAWNFNADTVRENITLYAGWEENAPQIQQGDAQQDNTQQNNDDGENNNTADPQDNGDAADGQAAETGDTQPSEDTQNTSGQTPQENPEQTTPAEEDPAVAEIQQNNGQQGDQPDDQSDGRQDAQPDGQEEEHPTDRPDEQQNEQPEEKTREQETETTAKLRTPLRAGTETYSLTFVNDPDRATGSNFSVALSVSEQGDSIRYTLPENTFFMAKDAYYFAYWSYNGLPYAPGSVIDVNQSAQVTAVFANKIDCKVFIANNEEYATYGNGNGYYVQLYKLPSEQTVSFTLPENTHFTPKADCDFLGWKYRNNETLYQPGDVIQVYETYSLGQSDGGGTLFAIFGRRRSYTVTFAAAYFEPDYPMFLPFESHYITTGMSSVTTAKETKAGGGVSYTLPANAFVINDNSYISMNRWSTGLYTHSNSYSPGDTIFIRENTTLYAWYYTDRSSSFTDYTTWRFEPNGGTGTTGSQIALWNNTNNGYVGYISACGFTPPAGKRFYAWRNKSTGEEWFPGVFVVTSADAVFEAVWTNENVISNVRVSVSHSGGNTVKRGGELEFTALVTGDGPVNPTGVTWHLEGNASSTTTILVTEPGKATLHVAEDETAERIVVYATATDDTTVCGGNGVWVSDIYIVTFHANGHGTAPAAQDVKQGSTATVPAAPTADGYTFDGWFTESACTNRFDFTTPITKDTELYAGWTKDTVYNVSVSRNYGAYTTASASPSSGTEGTSVTLTATPGSGHTFKEWQVLSGGVTLVDSTKAQTTFTIGADDVQVRAVFEVMTSVSVTTDGNGQASANPSGNMTRGTQVALSATPNAGYVFKEWEITRLTGEDVNNPVVISDETDPAATFYANATEITVKAHFEQVYAIANVTVSPSANVRVIRGETLDFTAAVTGTGTFDDSVTWSVATPNGNALAQGTGIDANGRLSVDAAERATSLIVTATSNADSSKNGSVTVYLYDGFPTGITISPDTAAVQKGDTLEFTASVTWAGQQMPGGVTWEVLSPSSDDTKIEPFAQGKARLTVAADESEKTLTVIAHAPMAGSIYATATVVVGNGMITGITISPASATVERSGTLEFTATVTGIGRFDNDVMWEINGDKWGWPTTTNITSYAPGKARLTIDRHEKSTTLTITAEAKDGSGICATATVTVVDAHPWYAISFDADGGGGTMADETVYGNSSYTLPVCSFTAPYGKQFKAWLINGTEYQPGASVMVYADMTVKAVWEDATPMPVTHTVTYQVINGTWDGSDSNERTEQVRDGKQPANVPTGMQPNSGYEGGAWDTDPAGVAITGDRTFTYSFTAKPVTPTVTYQVTVSVASGQDGWGSASGAGSYHENADATLTAVPNTGYRFVCWKENGVRVSIDETYTFKVTGPCDLVAEFEEDGTTPGPQPPTQYSVTVTAPHGGTASGGGTFNENASVTVKATPDALYRFVKWTENGTEVSTDESYTFTLTGNRDLQAVFEPVPGTITGITLSPASALVMAGKKQQFTAKVTGTGNFNSAVIWSVSGNTSAQTTIDAQGLLTVGADETASPLTVTVTSVEDHTKTASATVDVTVANPTMHTVTFDSDGGSAVASQHVFDGDKASKPADPTRSGYTFVEWMLNGKPYDFNTPVTSDITLKAKWTQNAGTEHKVDIRGFSDADIPQSLKDAGFGTVTAIQNALLQAVVNKSGTSYGKNYALYEVTLMVSFDGGSTWEIATPENFPAGGITVVLPYPSGTGKDTHNFAVSHMFTVAMRGHVPGGIETPTPHKKANGIQVTLDGLSPVLVSWTEVTNSNPSNPTNPTNPSQPSDPSNPSNPAQPSNPGGNGTGTGSGTSTSQPTASDGQTSAGNINPVAINTGTTTTRTTGNTDGQNARMGQTGDDIYERLGIHTMIFLAALLLLAAQLRMLAKDNCIQRVSWHRRNK